MTSSKTVREGINSADYSDFFLADLLFFPFVFLLFYFFTKGNIKSNKEQLRFHHKTVGRNKQDYELQCATKRGSVGLIGLMLL